MPDVTASTGDGYVGVNNTSKTASRDATSAVFGNTTTTSMIAIHAFFFSRYYIYNMEKLHKQLILHLILV